MPDLRLKLAAEEIKAVLKSHDIAGCFVLGSKTHTEFFLAPEASWSCVKKEGPDGIRIRCKRVDYPTREAQGEALRLTIGLINGLGDACRHSLLPLFDGLLQALAKAGNQWTHQSWRDDGPAAPFQS